MYKNSVSHYAMAIIPSTSQGENLPYLSNAIDVQTSGYAISTPHAPSLILRIWQRCRRGESP